jgi:hypothetical protein
MIGAISTNGEVYWALSQANTDDRTMALFIWNLVKKLDLDRKNWRLDSLLQLDGAAYHKSESTIRLLQDLKVPYCVSGPYSYDGTPIELFWAQLKFGDINPGGERLSKSK